jgi:hypothetical protein
MRYTHHNVAFLLVVLHHRQTVTLSIFRWDLVRIFADLSLSLVLISLSPILCSVHNPPTAIFLEAGGAIDSRIFAVDQYFFGVFPAICRLFPIYGMRALARHDSGRWQLNRNYVDRC